MLVGRVAAEDEPAVKAVVAHILQQLQKAGLQTPGNRDGFTAHMSLVKMSRQHCRMLPCIPPQSYSANMGTVFGLQRPEELHLCHMTAAKGVDGFYLREGRVANAPDAAPLADVLARLAPQPQQPPRVIILRGLPGSGKSTIVEHMQTAWGFRPAVCSADLFFTQASGLFFF